MHIALLGDSTLDNKAYTSGAPSVTDHLNDLLPEAHRASLVAVDGAKVRDIPYQLDTCPPEATHIVLSVGGNDAVTDIGLLSQSARTVGEALSVLHEATERFDAAYRSALQKVVATGLPVTVCAVYNGNFPEAAGGRGPRQAIVSTALRLWNDRTIQAAIDYKCPVIDLRRVCTEPSDFTLQIEPNAQGGRTIAEALFRSLTEPDAFFVGMGPTR
ncbi:SGNH/GDSL hydrolase family protein [Salisaeta longa]|uniref:SGNH/GDSL hydrolase family protein n=1 Tax=Salisaeta longa TaxID=503170 RepID=UPI0003B5B2CA|nr:SGNH/GDSL hydrolase family protein [Salisaeta longa]